MAGSKEFNQAIANANKRISGYETALETGDPAVIRKAALELQKDPLAVRQINNVKSDAFKTRLNQELTSVQSQTKAAIRQKLAQRYGVPESEVTFFEATNPSQQVKVGQDWDVTARVKGKDVPLDVAREVAHESFYEAANGQKPPSAKAAKQFAHQQAVEVTNRIHPEAYGGGGKKLVYNQSTGKYEVMTEGAEIILGDKSKALRDPQQLSEVMEHKSNMARNTAAEIRNAGERYIAENKLSGAEAKQIRLTAEADAQGWELEQARQYTKQYSRQVEPRVESRGGEVHSQIKKGTEILEKVANGDITPAEGRARLKKMGETPESIIEKGSSQIEAAQKLGDTPKEIIRRAKAGEAPEDVFVDNVKDRLELKRMEKAAAKGEKYEPLTEDSGPGLERQARLKNALKRVQAMDTYIQEQVGVGKLPANASGLRQNINTAGAKAMGAVAVAGTAYEAGSIGYKMAKAKILYDEANQALLSGDEALAESIMAQAEALENETVQQVEDAGVMITAMVVAPALSGMYYTGKGAYGLTRMALESEYGKPVDQAVQDTMTGGMNLWDDLIRKLSGDKTISEQELEDIKKRQDAWMKILDSGAVELQEGATQDDLLVLIERMVKDGKIATLDDLGDLKNAVKLTPESQIARADCSKFPGTKAEWDASDGKVRCNCTEGKWSNTAKKCVNDKDAALAKADCSKYPNSVPQWDDEEGVARCNCTGDYVWNKGKTGCHLKPNIAVAQADCGSRPNVEKYWDETKEEVWCRCISGYERDPSGDGCVKTYARQEPTYDDMDHGNYDTYDSGGYDSYDTSGGYDTGYDTGGYDDSGVTDFVSDFVDAMQQTQQGSGSSGGSNCTGNSAYDTVMGQISGNGCGEGGSGDQWGDAHKTYQGASGGYSRPSGSSSSGHGGSATRPTGGPAQGEFSDGPPEPTHCVMKGGTTRYLGCPMGDGRWKGGSGRIYNSYREMLKYEQ